MTTASGGGSETGHAFFPSASRLALSEQSGLSWRPPLAVISALSWPSSSSSSSTRQRHTSIPESPVSRRCWKCVWSTSRSLTAESRRSGSTPGEKTADLGGDCGGGASCAGSSLCVTGFCRTPSGSETENRCRDEEGGGEAGVAATVGLGTFWDVRPVDAASQTSSRPPRAASHVSLGLLLTVTIVLLPLQSRGVETVSSASITAVDWLRSLIGAVEAVSAWVTTAAMQPRRGSPMEGVEAWLVSVSSVSWADDGEELQGDDGQQESQEQLV